MVLGFLATIKAGADGTAGRVAVIHHLGPQDAGSPLHVHHRENEWFYVLDGELTVWVGGQVIRAPAGSFVFGPQGTPHTFTVSSPGGASFLLVTEPAGFEAFMRTCAQPAQSLTLPPPPDSPPTRPSSPPSPPNTASKSSARPASPPDRPLPAKTTSKKTSPERKPYDRASHRTSKPRQDPPGPHSRAQRRRRGRLGGALRRRRRANAPERSAQRRRGEHPGMVRRFAGAFHTEFSLFPDEVTLTGANWAFERGTYKITLAPRTGGSPISDAGKYITIYHRQADGTWVMARDIWNSNNPLPGLS